jgi:uncharacterized Fe-S radical SAM superfamily protein PflX
MLVPFIVTGKSVMNLTALQPCQLCETKCIVDVAFTALEYCDTKLEFCVYTISRSWG